VPTFALVDDLFGAKGPPMDFLRRLPAFDGREPFAHFAISALTGSLRRGRAAYLGREE